MHLRDFPSLIKEAASEWSQDKASRLAAALSYYTLFSIAPLLLIAIAVAGAVLGEDAAKGRIAEEIQGLLGKQGAEAVQAMLASASKPGQGLIAGILGGAALLLGASGAVGQLQDALNTVWEVRPKPGQGIRGFLKTRFLSFSMVLGIAFLLLVSLVLSAGLSAVGDRIGSFLPGQGILLRAVDIAVSLGLVTFLFAALFKVLPDARIRWSDVWVGAFTTSLLFVLGRYLIGLYLGRGAVGSTFGAAGSLVIVLVWVYYASQILLFGAEFTQVYAARFGSRVVPEDDAEAVSKPEPLAGKPALEPRSGGAKPQTNEAGGQRKPQPKEAARGRRKPRLRPAALFMARSVLRRRWGAAAVTLSVALAAARAALRGRVPGGGRMRRG